MAYEVTANRRRPQKFSDLAGQEFVVSTLTSAISSNRIAHAYLFSGPRGVGKTSSARILAKSLNCVEGPTANPCGVCTNCKEITTGSSMDVIEIDGASNTSVNDIREIKDEVLFAPNSSRYKIYIIDEVHMLSNSAFNALLKTIEEPPEYIIFIFATTEIHKVPATIRSRCQQFNFRLIPTETLKNLIVEACDELNIKYNEDAVFWIAKEGNGSSRDAYTLYDQIVSFSEGEITLEKIKDKLGLVGLDNLNEIVELMIDGNTSEVLNKCDYILTTGVAVDQFITDLAEYYRNLLFLSSGITKEALLGCSSDRFSKKAVDSYTIEQLEHGVDLIIKLYKDIRYSVNPRFELELLLSRLTKLQNYISNSDILNKIKNIKESITGGTFSSEVKIAAKAPVMEEKKKSDLTNVDTDRESSSAASQFFNKFKSKNPVITPSEPVKKDEIEVIEKDLQTESNKQDIVKEEKIIDEQPQYTPSGNIEQDKKAIIRKLKSTHITLSSTLEKAERWELRGNEVVLSYKNPFEANLVEKEKSKVLQILKEFNNSINNIVVQKSSVKVDNSAKVINDEQIEKILTMFRGSIV